MSHFNPLTDGETIFEAGEWSIKRATEFDEEDGREYEYLFIVNSEDEDVWAIPPTSNEEFKEMLQNYSNSEILDHLIESCESY